MSSIITHIAYGAAIGSVGGAVLGRRQRHMTVLGMALAVLPDLDVLGLLLGVPYESFFGHRGFFHSPFFAMVCGLFVAALVHSAGRRTALCLGLTTFAVMTSHALLDALTTGGQGVMMFYPFSSERFFFDWRPIVVSPIGLRAFFSGWGLRVMLSELPWLLGAAALGLGAFRVSRQVRQPN